MARESERRGIAQLDALLAQLLQRLGKRTSLGCGHTCREKICQAARQHLPTQGRAQRLLRLLVATQQRQAGGQLGLHLGLGPCREQRHPFSTQRP